jgi:SAM-dependent methyltransferase
MTQSPVVSYDAVEEMAELYDHVPYYRQRADIAFYVRETRATVGSVLELASGTGRVLLPIARAGNRVVGVERSEQMIERCREKLAEEPEEIRARVTLHAGDMRDFELRERFGVVIMPFRPMQHLLTIDDQLACLAAVRRHIAPDGRLLFDVFNPDFRRIGTPVEGEFDDTPDTPLSDGRSFRRTGRVVQTHWVDQINDIELIYHITNVSGDAERRVHEIRMRWYTRAELEHLLARAGFRIETIYGDFDREPLSDRSREMIVIASPDRA